MKLTNRYADLDQRLATITQQKNQPTEDTEILLEDNQQGTAPSSYLKPL